MSSILANPARLRLPKGARNAVERARLTVVPVRRTRAPRMPFAVLVGLILGLGVVGLLLFNTHMQQQSFYATSLQTKADALVAKQQSLDMQLDRLRDPQRLAREGRKLGMVAPEVPAFIELGSGRILGIPTPARPEDFVAVKPPAAVKPASLDPAPIIVKVPATATVSPAAGSGTAAKGSAAGSNGAAPVKVHQPAVGAHPAPVQRPVD